MTKTNFTVNRTFGLAVLIILGLALFARTANYKFVWDDEPLYLNGANYPAQGRLDNLGKFWTPGKMPMFAPVTYTFWGVIASVSADDNTNKFGISPTLFHIANMFFHIVNSILVFLILLYLFKNNFAALIAASVFMLHPIQVESVAWVSELRGLLAAFFGLAAILFYIIGKKENGVSAKFVLRSIFVILLLVLSFLSKPTGIVFPIILLAISYFFLKTNTKQLRIDALGLLLLTILLIFLSVSAESKAAQIVPISLFHRLLLPFDSFIFYLYKLVLPINLTAVYGRTPDLIIHTSQIYIFSGVFTAIALVLYFKREIFKQYALGLLIAFIAILPTSGLVSYYYQTFSNVADRYFYIGMFGIAIVITLIFDRIKTQQRTLIAASLAVLFFILSFSQLSSWANDYKHWDNVIKQSSIGVPQAYMGRGEENLLLGKYSKAIEDFTSAIALNPKEPLYYYNRANAYLDIKQYDLAIKDYSNAIAKNSKLLNAYVNRGLAYMEAVQPLLAIPDFKQALVINPQQSDILNNLGICFAMSGHYDSAEVYFHRVLEINPDDNEAIENLKLLQSEKNKKDN